MSIPETKAMLGLKEEACENMAALRVEIDQLDQKIVELLTVRQSYMDQAAHIKQDRNKVRDNERVEDVIKKVSNHARETGGNPELVETLYRTMIEWSINYEMGQFDILKSNEKP